MGATVFLLLLVTTPLVTAGLIDLGDDGTGYRLITPQSGKGQEYGTKKQRRIAIDDPDLFNLKGKINIPSFYDDEAIATPVERSIDNAYGLSQDLQLNDGFGERNRERGNNVLYGDDINPIAYKRSALRGKAGKRDSSWTIGKIKKKKETGANKSKKVNPGKKGQ